MGQPRRRFTPEFKQDAVDLCRRSGKSECQVARELGIPQPTLNRWMRQVAGAAPGSNSFLATEELKVLRREVEQLRMERDILKKAVVGSGGVCNSCLQYSRWRLKPQCLPRTLIQA
jgi:transposase